MEIFKNLWQLLISDYHLCFFIPLVISFLILIISGVLFLRKIFNHSNRDDGTSFRNFTLWVLIAAAVMFLPIYYKEYDFKDQNDLIRPALLSIHNAMRLFVLDGDFDFVRDHIVLLPGNFRFVFSSYAVFLYVIAPIIFTFTIFLTIFRDFPDQLRLKSLTGSPLYMFSSLNEDSSAMAKSILKEKHKDKTGPKNLIVFCNTSGIKSEGDEGNEQSRLIPNQLDNHTLVLTTTKEVTELDTTRFKNDVTYFLMDRDEAKNIRDASELSEKISDICKKNTAQIDPERQHSRRIYVYSSASVSIPLIDALASKSSVPETTVDWLQKVIDKSFNDADTKSRGQKESNSDRLDHIENIQKSLEEENQKKFFIPFSITRIDSKKLLAIRILKKINESDNFQSVIKNKNEITVTLLGLGGIGRDILASILCTYQIYGIRLTVNVIDRQGHKPGQDPDRAGYPLYDNLVYEWPELMETNKQWQNNPKHHPDTESNYDIRFYLGTDCFSGRFLELFEKEDSKERLLKSDLVICAMGDDDKNLKAALMMRQLFVSKNDKNDLEPYIFAVVYDDQKAENFSKQSEMTNYKGIRYGLTVGGTLSFQHSFPDLTDEETLRRKAFLHHIRWVFVKYENENGKYDEENDWMKKSVDEKKIWLTEQLNKYFRYEYYRQSSIAVASHKSFLKKLGKNFQDESLKSCQHDPKNVNCRCPKCQARITEHMRWNVYMRVNGYRHGENLNSMAKIHPCLKAWSDLPFEERVKD